MIISRWYGHSRRAIGILLLCGAGAAMGNAQTIRINCGGWHEPVTAADGSRWAKDAHSNGGQLTYDASVDSPDWNLYGTGRSGLYTDFQYNIPVSNGNYTLKLKFAELERRTSGQRVFDVVVNGVKVLNRYDIAARVGIRKPIDESFPVSVSNGLVRIEFIGIVGRSAISGIELTAGGAAAAPGQPTSPTAPAPAAPGEANHFFVAPNGSSAGDGSISRPWDLATALRHPSAVAPGATIWLRGGTHGNGGVFTSYLAGTAAAPIIVRQYPGERATVNGNLQIRAPHTWFWGFEITRIPRASDGDCVNTFENSQGTRLLNMVIHDCGSNGVGYWRWAENSEIYGTLIYYNGAPGTTRGHGHGIYVQNDNIRGGKTIADNIIFKGMGFGIQAYGSGSAGLKNVRLDGNIVFEPGVLYGKRVDGILVTVGSGAEDIAVERNHVYMKPDRNEGYSRMGWLFSGTEKNVVARNNYFIGGESAAELWNWNRLEFTGNTVYSQNSLTLVLNHRPEQSLSNYNIQNNTYFGSGIFRYNRSNRNFSGMQALGIERNSRFTPGRPTGVWSFVRPNKYEKGRANVVVYNWDMRSSISVDIGDLLSVGQRYEIRDAQNYFASPVASGTYQGGPIPLPLSRTTVATPVGSVPRMPVHTGPEFGVFVILPLP
ncbi:MAG: malectin domain-containing carbohydrate-binding protein [Bryobacteraceae bacterium]